MHACYNAAMPSKQDKERPFTDKRLLLVSVGPALLSEILTENPGVSSKDFAKAVMGKLPQGAFSVDAADAEVMLTALFRSGLVRAVVKHGTVRWHIL